MTFELTDDQTMLRDMVDRVAAERHDFEARRAAIASDAGWLPGFWRELAELGLLGASLPENVGGLGGGSIEMMLINEAFGRRLVLSPYVPTMAGANLIARAGTPIQKEMHIPEILCGERVIALAITEGPGASIDGIATAAESEGGSYRLTGQKPLVIAAPWSDHLLVAARADGTDMLAAFMVPTDAPGLTAHPFPTIDGGRASKIVLDRVQVPATNRIGGDADLTEPLRRICDEAAVALCADACGSIVALLDATVAYAKTRRQFGQPIGKFQVLQHRMVDMLLARDQAISITHRAALALGGDRVARERAVSAAKAHVGRVGRQVAQAAVQIHGGIGTTEELDVSHHFRRIEIFHLQFGSVDAHIRRYADLLDEPPAPLEA